MCVHVFHSDAPRSRRSSIDTASKTNSLDHSAKKPKGFGKGIKKIINRISSEEKNLLNQTLLKHRHCQQQMAEYSSSPLSGGNSLRSRYTHHRDLCICYLATYLSKVEWLKHHCGRRKIGQNLHRND